MDELNRIIDTLANYALDRIIDDDYCDALLLAGQLLCKYDKNAPLSKKDAIAIVEQYYDADEVEIPTLHVEKKYKEDEEDDATFDIDDDDDFDIDAELEEMLEDVDLEEAFDLLMMDEKPW